MDFYLAEPDNYVGSLITEMPADMIAPRNILLAGDYSQVNALLKGTSQLKKLFRIILQVSSETLFGISLVLFFHLVRLQFSHVLC
jgi:hypothetical protein